MRAVSLDVSGTMRDKVTGQCPQTTSFEEKGEPKRNRNEILLLTNLILTARPQQLAATYPSTSSVVLYIHRNHKAY